jgi:secreted trypsin-like serine protease
LQFTVFLGIFMVNNTGLKSVLLLCLLLTTQSFAANTTQPSTQQKSDSLAVTQIVGGQEAEAADWPWMTAYVVTFQAIATSLQVDGVQYSTQAFSEGPAGQASGEIVGCGLGDSVCADAQNKVCLIQRGTINFSEKVLNCEAGGGVGVIIYNNEIGPISGTLGEGFAGNIPVVAITQQDGETLLTQAGKVAQLSVTADSALQQDASCGATFLGNKWVLTAAHCVDSPDAPFFKMNVGEYDLSDGAENAIAIKNIYVHPLYDADAINNDVALVELVSSVNAPAVEIASIATTDQYAIEHSPAFVAGWGGRTGYAPGEGPTSNFPDILHQVELNLTTNEECRQILAASLGINAENTGITDKMICAPQPVGIDGRGSCQGDSGGPLIVQTGTGPQQVGIVSWGIGCAATGFPGVYTRVAEFKDWLNTLSTGIAIEQKADFGIVPVGVSQSIELPISNNATTTVNLTFSIDGSTNFTVGSHNCSNLAANASCAVTVNYAASQAGEQSANVMISADDSNVAVSQARVVGTAIAQANGIAGVAGPSNANIQWFSGGALPWIANPLAAGVESGAIDDSQDSILMASISGEGTLSFEWSVSSEDNEEDANDPFDALYVYVDNELYSFISGELTAFETISNLELGAGTHRITWVYSKDPAVSEGDDKAYLRNVTFTAKVVAPPPTPTPTPTPNPSSSSGGGSAWYLLILMLGGLLIRRQSKHKYQV